MKRIILLTIIAFICKGCSCEKLRCDKIEYKTFPALEKIICARVSSMDNKAKDSLFVLIIPDFHGSNGSFSKYIIYLPNINNVPKNISAVVRKSNRGMILCGKFIPVYIEYIDQFFMHRSTQEEKTIDQPLLHNWNSKDAIAIIDIYSETVE